MDETYSFDFGAKSATNATKSATNATKSATNACDLKQDEVPPLLSKEEENILSLIRNNSRITQKEIQEATGISLGTIKRILPRLQERGILLRSGSRRFGEWKIK